MREFEALKPWLTGESVGRSQADAARELGEGAARVAIHRLRRRFRELVKAEIAQMVAERRDVADCWAWSRRSNGARRLRRFSIGQSFESAGIS